MICSEVSHPEHFRGAGNSAFIPSDEGTQLELLECLTLVGWGLGPTSAPYSDESDHLRVRGE